jgi:hypothetical protein
MALLLQGAVVAAAVAVTQPQVAQEELEEVAQEALVDLPMVSTEQLTLEVEAEVLFSTVLPTKQVMAVLASLSFVTLFKEKSWHILQK